MMKKIENIIKIISLMLVFVMASATVNAQEYNAVGTNTGSDARLKGIERFLEGKLKHLKETLAALTARSQVNTDFRNDLEGDCPSGQALVSIDADGSLNCRTVVWRQVYVATYDWYEGPWNGCSTACGGTGGTQSRVVECHDGNGNVVADSFCTAPKPDTCNSTLCTATTTGAWTTGSWSACSETCGGGTRTRSVTCDYDSCTGARPASTQNCNTQPCATTNCRTISDWDFDGFCTPDTNPRPQCSHFNFFQMFCNGNPNCSVNLDIRTNTCARCVADIEICTTTGPTSTPQTGPWTMGAWGACSATCGGGTQTRTARCNHSGGCGGQPPTSRSCNTQACAAAACEDKTVKPIDYSRPYPRNVRLFQHPGCECSAAVTGGSEYRNGIFCRSNIRRGGRPGGGDTR